MGSAERLRADLRRAEADLADLREELGALADPDVVALDDEHDSEGSTIGFERARVAGLIDRAERHVTELQGAVRRVAEGSYGSCDSCGEAIPEERLAALPATRHCVGCARRAPAARSARRGH